MPGLFYYFVKPTSSSTGVKLPTYSYYTIFVMPLSIGIPGTILNSGILIIPNSLFLAQRIVFQCTAIVSAGWQNV